MNLLLLFTLTSTILTDTHLFTLTCGHLVVTRIIWKTHETRFLLLSKKELLIWTTTESDVKEDFAVTVRKALTPDCYTFYYNYTNNTTKGTFDSPDRCRPIIRNTEQKEGSDLRNKKHPVDFEDWMKLFYWQKVFKNESPPRDEDYYQSRESFEMFGDRVDFF